MITKMKIIIEMEVFRKKRGNRDSNNNDNNGYPKLVV